LYSNNYIKKKKNLISYVNIIEKNLISYVNHWE